MIRFSARVRIYLCYLRGGRLFERGRLFISWENADGCFCTGALIENFKEDEHAITKTKYGRLLEWEYLLKRGAYCVTQIRRRGTVPLNMLSGLLRR